MSEPKHQGGKTASIVPRRTPKKVVPPPPLWKSFLPPAIGLIVLSIGLFWFLTQRSGSAVGQVLNASNDQAISQFQFQLDTQPFQAANAETGGVVLNGVKPGKHTLQVQASGFQRLQYPLVLKAGETHRFHISLKPLATPAEAPSEHRLILTRRPNQVIVQSADFREQGRVGLAGWPRDMVVHEGLIYIAEYDKDQISEVDPKTWRISRKLALPRNSGPKRLVLTPHQQLLVLCEISKEVLRIDLPLFEIAGSQRLGFARSPLDMVLANQSLYLLFTGEVKRLDGDGKAILQEISIPGIFATRLVYSEAERRFYLLNGKDLLLMNETGQYDLIDLDTEPASVLGALGGGQVLLARGKKLWLYDINTRSILPSSQVELGGEVEWIVPGGGLQVMIAQKNPHFLLRGDRTGLNNLQRQGLEGSPEALKTALF